MQDAGVAWALGKPEIAGLFRHKGRDMPLVTCRMFARRTQKQAGTCAHAKPRIFTVPRAGMLRCVIASNCPCARQDPRNVALLPAPRRRTHAVETPQLHNYLRMPQPPPPIALPPEYRLPQLPPRTTALSRWWAAWRWDLDH
jgi:hypothetical protein